MAEFELPLAFASKRKKKIDKLGDLPRFSWEEKVGHDIIGQGTFGPFFLQIRNLKKSRAENVVVKELLSTAQDFTETVIKEAKILKGVTAQQHCIIQGHLQGAYGDDVTFPILKIPTFKNFPF